MDGTLCRCSLVLVALLLSVGGCGHNAGQGQVEGVGDLPAEIPPESRQVEDVEPQTQKTQQTSSPGSPADAVPAPSTSTPDWGDLKARFVYDGEPPERKPLKITADIDFCGKQEILEEDLVVHPGNHGVANVIAWLYLRPGEPMPAIHPAYAETAEADVDLDAKGCRFEPHVCLLRTTQTLILRNRNPIGDSAKIDMLSNPGINITIPVGGAIRHQVQRAERLPARVSCSVHPWESGWLLVKEHPYMAVSNEAGELAIENLPTGTWTFQFWHEKSGYVNEVKRDGQPSSWKRGRIDIEIQPGGNDLGEVLLAPSLFAES
jgi:hypothetical protein